MSLIRTIECGVAALCLSTLVGCVDAPGAPSPSDASDPLAQTFDALSRASAEYGDLARSDGFAFAALSVRRGVLPSRLELKWGTVTETYDAFVTGAEWDSTLPEAIRPPPRRSLIGWRQSPEGLIRVIAFSTPRDSSVILSPVALGTDVSTVAVYSGASAMQNDGRDTPQGRPDLVAARFGTSGWVKIRELSVGVPCAGSAGIAGSVGGIRCDEVRYQLRVDVTMQRLAGRPPQVVPGGDSRRVTTPSESVVNGLRLRFGCIAPSSVRGCA